MLIIQLFYSPREESGTEKLIIQGQRDEGFADSWSCRLYGITAGLGVAHDRWQVATMAGGYQAGARPRRLLGHTARGMTSPSGTASDTDRSQDTQGSGRPRR